MLDSVLNGKRSSELPARSHAYLRKAWARFAAKYGFCIGKTNAALSQYGRENHSIIHHILCAHVKILG